MLQNICKYKFATDALFLDFDGTIVNLVLKPENVVVSLKLISMLRQLYQVANGALAIISGRSIEQIDHFLIPLRLPIAGVHGLERRNVTGNIIRLPVPSMDKLKKIIVPLVMPYKKNILLEQKYGALALHYRQAPHLKQFCLEIVHHAIMNVPGFVVLYGKMVIEIKADITNKGDAIAAFMREIPFIGRRPLFAGDDITDEIGFTRVQSTYLGGIGIKIGEGVSQALMHINNPQELCHWLEDGLLTKLVAISNNI